MNKWEYSGVNIDGRGIVTSGPYQGNSLWQMLPLFGKEGWELVTSLTFSSGVIELVFKRPVGA
jgi:hypothetical protein